MEQDTLGMLSGCYVGRRIPPGWSNNVQKRTGQYESEQYGPARLNPRGERRDTLVSGRGDTVLLGCFGYREDTSGQTPADTVGLVGEIVQGSAKQIDSLQGAAYSGAVGRLGGRIAVTTLPIWLERTRAPIETRAQQFEPRQMEQGS